MLFNLVKVLCIITVYLSLAESSKLKHGIAKRQIQQATVCGNNECTYGSCEILTTSTFQCHCQAGITGTNCNQVALAGSNACASNPCYGPDSECVPQGTTGFVCNCGTGLVGPTCRQHTGQCRCQNGATCNTQTVNNLAAFTCGCQPGFGGELCQFSTTLTSCQNLGCQNGGTCTILSVCACPTGFTGNLCQFSTATVTAAPVVPPAQINLCAPGICQNGAACIQLSANIGFCSCLSGFSGPYCNISPFTGVTMSTPTTLANPITVSTTTTTTTTTVAPTAAANPNLVRCTFSNPCLNGGTCNFDVTNNNIQCSCLPNFTGFICQTQTAFCANNPCRNGGVCIQGTGNAGSCSCAAGFGGTYCEVGLTCNPNPCLNNHQCLMINGGPTCLCSVGYNLPFCS